MLTLKLLCDLRLDREDVRGAVDELLLPPPRSKAGDKDKDKGKAKAPAPARDARCAAASALQAFAQPAQILASRTDSHRSHWSLCARFASDRHGHRDAGPALLHRY